MNEKRVERMTVREWGVLLVLCGAVFLEDSDVAMISVALPSIRADLGLAMSTLPWVVSAYVLGYAGFILLGGRAADLFGRRRMFLLWLAVFVAFSGLGAAATEAWMLLAARFVTGVAAAFMAPAGLSIITSGLPEGPRRNRALLVYAGTAAAGFSTGLVLGGLLAAISWRWVFIAPVILAAALLVVAWRLIPRAPRPERAGGGFDLPGALTVTGGLALFVLAVERATHVPATVTAGTLAGALALLGLFVVLQRRSANPLVRLGILRGGPLLRANLVHLLFAAAFFGFQFIAVLYLRDLRGWSTVETSLALLVTGIDAVVAPTITPRLVNRFGNLKVIFGGLVVAVLSYALFLPIGMDWTYAAMFPGLLLQGLAFSLVYGPVTIAGTDGVDESEHGLAGGLLYTSFQIGAALGLSAATAVHIAVTDGSTSPIDQLAGHRAAFAVPLAAAIAATAVIAYGLARRRNDLTEAVAN